MAIQSNFDETATGSASHKNNVIALDKLEVVFGPYLKAQRNGPYAYHATDNTSKIDDLYLELRKDRKTNEWNLVMEVRRLEDEGGTKVFLINLSKHDSLREGMQAMDKEIEWLKGGTMGFLSRMMEWTPFRQVKQDKYNAADSTKAYAPQVRKALQMTSQNASAERRLELH